MKCLLQPPSTCCKFAACRPAFSTNSMPALPLRPCRIRSTSLSSNTVAAAQRQQCHRSIVCLASTSSAQQQAAPVTAAAAAAAVPTATAAAQQQQIWRPLPFAALSRVLLTANNSTVFRTALNKRQPVSGPMGLLLFLMTLIAASFAAIRGLLVKKGKSCKSCRGFGLQRCRLCLGSGRVDWAAKLKHFDVCPLCMNKRFIICSECGGHYHRPMFSHRRRQVGGALEPIAGERADEVPGFEGPIVLNLAGAGAAAGGSIALQPMDATTRGPVLSSIND